jgi:hypothetical protein
MRSGVEVLLQKARQRTGLSDCGDDWLMGSLQTFVGGLDEPHISDFGRQFLNRQAVKDLCRRLAIIDCLKQNPEIEETSIPPDKLDQEQPFCLNRMGKVYAKLAEFENARPERVLNMQYVALLSTPVEEISRGTVKRISCWIRPWNRRPGCIAIRHVQSGLLT